MQFKYNAIKNANLLNTRGIGFEEIIHEIRKGNLINIVDHHNTWQYPNQQIMQVKCLGKIYCVPYVKEADGIFFLKTLYPSRKATKKYIEN